MQRFRLGFLTILVSPIAVACGSAHLEQAGTASQALSHDQGTGPFHNAAGDAANLSTTGAIDVSNAFFQSLGTNGRACVTCHSPADGFSVTPRTVQQLFDQCGLSDDGPGDDLSADQQIACAIFRTNDGSNSPNADVSTPDARRAAYNLLLSKGLIRFSFPVPQGAQFDVIQANDPYGFGTTAAPSVFRRPLAAANLLFASSVMWDLRETSRSFLVAPFTPDVTHVASLNDQLKSQALDATLGHAQAMTPGLTDAQQQSIVDFELHLFSAQARVDGAGSLSDDGALGGPLALSNQAVTPVCGNLVVVDNNPSFPQCQSYTFTPIVFTLFDAWANLQGTDAKSQMRASIARGQALFNTRKTQSPAGPFFDHSGDNKNTTCSTCHSDFNAGAPSVPVGFQNVLDGVGPNSFNSPSFPTDFTSPDLPTYTLRCNAHGMFIFKVSKGAAGCHDGSEPGIPADQVTLNDPGRALITGSWGSVGAFKCPTLRNLSAHAPYFHDGSAATLADVVEHYKEALGFQFTDDEKQDLVNFLSAL
jgi:cytochrome c peroxidase